MNVVGCLDNIIFMITDSRLITIQEFKWDSSARFSEHARHLKDPLLEFTGNNLDKISFTMHFSKNLGVDPITEITKLLDAEREGRAMLLLLGFKLYGKGKWVITSLSKSLEFFDNHGRVIAAKVDVSLTAYSDR